MTIRVVIVSVLCHVIQSAQTNTTAYIGCYQRSDYTHFEWDQWRLLTTNFYRECESKAKEKGWEVFVVNEDSSCHGSGDALKLLKDTDASKDCVKKEINGEYVEVGGPEGMSTYQIVEHRIAQFDEKTDPEINCTPETAIRIFDAQLGNPSCPEGKRVKNVTTSINSMCAAASECKLHDYNYDVGGCSYTLLNITFGCVFHEEQNDKKNGGWSIVHNIRWIIFLLVVVIVLIVCWRRRRTYLRRYPRIRDACWSLHQYCPCLDLYPRDATDPHSMFGGHQIDVQPNPVTGATYPPPATDGTYPLPATGGTYPPPAMGGTYPPVTGAEVPPPYDPSAAPSGAANIPPPSYSEATTSGGRTTGGWFTKLAR